MSADIQLKRTLFLSEVTSSGMFSSCYVLAYEGHTGGGGRGENNGRVSKLSYPVMWQSRA
jgi:hypothetical protein